MIETEVFKELNIFGPNGEPTPDLIGDAPPQEQEREPKCCGLFRSSRPRSRVCFYIEHLITIYFVSIATIYFFGQKRMSDKSD